MPAVPAAGWKSRLIAQREALREGYCARPVAAELLVVDTDEGMTIYVGPAFTYFEVVTVGSDVIPPERLNNAQWRQQLQSKPYPAAPTWTQSFRLAVQSPPRAQTLPVTSATQNPPVTERQSIFLPLIQQEDTQK